MEDELLFRLVFIAIYGVFCIVRVYFRFYKFKTESTEIVSRDEPTEYGKAVKIAISACVLGYLGSMIIYVIVPDLIAWAYFPLPVLVRWLGAIVSLITIPLLGWIHLTLGRHYSADLIIKENHSVVTSGPYSRVRHPMYTVLLTFSLGMSIVSSNLILIISSILLIIPFPFLARQEEQMLLEALGEDYSHYMERTGRFFPRFRQKK